MAVNRKRMAEIGRRGGLAGGRSEAKTRANRQNGKLGGEARTQAKTLAAQKNGRRGGRPRRFFACKFPVQKNRKVRDCGNKRAIRYSLQGGAADWPMTLCDQHKAEIIEQLSKRGEHLVLAEVGRKIPERPVTTAPAPVQSKPSGQL